MTPQIKNRIEQIRRREVPEGYKRTKVGIVPVDWNVDVLGNFISECKVLSNDIEKYPVYSSSRQGLIPQSQYYDNREATETNLGYKIVPKGYVTYRHMSDDDIFHFNINDTESDILVSSEYPVFTTGKQGCLGYIIPLLNEMPRFRHFCRMQKMGGTRTRLYFKNLCAFQSAFPPLAEQKKIAEILAAQDRVIALLDRKIEQLQKMKKVFLQKMFPAKGQTVPEWRFKGFTAPWEQRKFSDVVEIGSGMDYKHLGEGDIPVYGTGGFMLSVDEALSEDKDAIGIGRKGTIDKPYILRAPFWTVDTLFYCIPRDDYDLDFTNCLFQNVDWKMKDESTGVPSLSKVIINGVETIVPSLAEQKRIGEFFKSIDNLITLHQRKRDEEKRKKKALMQLLLTGIVRVKT